MPRISPTRRRRGLRFLYIFENSGKKVLRWAKAAKPFEVSQLQGYSVALLRQAMTTKAPRRQMVMYRFKTLQPSRR